MNTERKEHLKSLLLATLLGTIVGMLIFGSFACALVVPDWNSRPKGLNQHHKPEYVAWTSPMWRGKANKKKDGTSYRWVTLYMRANHTTGTRLLVNWNGRRHAFDPHPDQSWSLTAPAGLGQHNILVTFYEGERTVAERKVTLIIE